MFISENTKNGVQFAAHESAGKAVSYLLDQLGDDYARHFWASDDGEDIVTSSTSCLDFGVAVYRSAADAATRERMRHVRFPASDPVHGAGGPLVGQWRETQPAE